MLCKIFSDEHLTAIYKPANLHSVRVAGSDNSSVADLLLPEDPSLAASAPSPDDAGLIQRLDFGTSGVMIAAKNPVIWQKLRSDTRTGAIKKTYFALVEGKFAGQVKSRVFLGSPYRRGKKVSVSLKKKSRFVEACSMIDAISFFPDDNCSLLRVIITAGRRHQIRAQLAYLRFPLLGDVLYGSTRSINEFSLLDVTATKDVPPFFLHAGHITLKHPVTGIDIAISAPLPAYLQKLKSYLIG